MSKTLKEVVCQQLKAFAAELESAGESPEESEAANCVVGLVRLRDTMRWRAQIAYEAVSGLRAVYELMTEDERRQYEAKGSVRDFIGGVQARLNRDLWSIEKQLGFET